MMFKAYQGEEFKLPIVAQSPQSVSDRRQVNAANR